MPTKIIFTQGQENSIIDLYLTYKHGLSKISKIIGRDIDVIRRVLNDNNVPRFKAGELNRKYNFDFSFFKKIDSPIKAQVAGMIAADGYVSNIEKLSGNYVSIGIKHTDEKYLNDIKYAMKYEGPIRYCQNNAVLCVCSNELVRNLNNIGIVNCKSLILKFPTQEQVPSEFVRDYIRGYFDGDGGISLYETQPQFAPEYLVGEVSLALTKEFGVVVKQIIEDEVKINCGLRPDERCPIWSLIISGNSQVLKFLHWLYQDAPFVMQRKYDRYQLLHNEYKSRKLNRSKIFKDVASKRNNTNIKARADKMKTTVWFQKDGVIYKVRGIWGFAIEKKLCRAHLYRVIGRRPRYISHKGWSLYDINFLGIPKNFIELNY